MTYPDLKLRVAFALDPLNPTSAVDSDWTDFDVAHSVSAVDVVTGKQAALDTLQPGTLSATLDNQDRRYDPLNPSGPYYGNLVPGKRMQFTATYGTSSYELFNGFVDGYRLSWAQLRPGDTTMACTDAVKYLRQPLVEDAISEAIKASAPSAYYRLSETSGDVLVDSSGHGRHGSWGADLKDAHADGLVGANDGALKLPPLDAATFGTLPASVMPDLSSCSVEFWFKAEHPPKAGSISPLFYSLLSLGGLFVEFIPAGGLLSGTFDAWLADGGSGLAIAATGVGGDPPHVFSVCDGRAHLISLAYDGSQLRIFVDGIDRTISHSESGGPLSGGFGTTILINKPADWDGETVLDELAFFPGDTDAARQARWAAELSEWDGDRTGDRFVRVMDTISWPLWTSTPGTSRLGKARWSAGTKAIDYLSALNASEQGDIVIAHWDYGKVEFRDQTWRVTDGRSTSVQAVFSDQPDVVPDEISFLLGVNPDQPPGDESPTVERIRYESVELLYDESTAVRQITVNWDGGSVTVTDPTATVTDVIKSATVATLLPTEDAARSLANWLLLRYSQVFLQVRSITVAPTLLQDTQADRAWKAVLGLREGDRIRIERQPGGTGPLWQFDVVIEGREHRIAAGVEQWGTTFWCKPVDSTLVWLLDITPFDQTVLSF